MARRTAINPADTHNSETALVTDFTNDTGLAPWQQAGNPLAENLSVADVLERSGNNFKVDTVPAFAKVGDVFVPAKDSKMVIRTDNNAVLGVVGNKYKVIQNEDQVGTIASLVDSGFATWDTAGLVYGGQIGWAMLKLKDEITLAGNDKVQKYLMALWSHNGTFSFRVFPAPLRAFCANVLNTLLAQAQNGITIRHTRTADARMKEAARIIEASQGFYNNFTERATKLLEAKMSDNQMKDLTDYLFPSREKDGEEVVSTRTANIREKLMELWTNGAGHEAIRGTAWAGYNAVAEFTDHFRSTRVTEGGDENDSRFASTMWGTGSQMKGQAVKWIDQNVLA